MPDRTLRVITRSDDRADFVCRLRRWLDENDALVAGLVRLRELPKSEKAVAEVLDVPELLRVRLSWDLWTALVLGDGDVDPDALIFGKISLGTLEQARLAIYGVEIDPLPSHLRPV